MQETAWGGGEKGPHEKKRQRNRATEWPTSKFSLTNPVLSPHLTFPEANANVIKSAWNLPCLSLPIVKIEHSGKGSGESSQSGPWTPAGRSWELGALNDWACASFSRKTDAQTSGLENTGKTFKCQACFCLLCFHYPSFYSLRNSSTKCRIMRKKTDSWDGMLGSNLVKRWLFSLYRSWGSICSKL